MCTVYACTSTSAVYNTRTVHVRAKVMHNYCRLAVVMFRTNHGIVHCRCTYSQGEGIVSTVHKYIHACTCTLMHSQLLQKEGGGRISTTIHGV